MGVDPASLAITMALNAASMAITASQSIEGPRLDSLGVTTSDYGQPHNYAYGTKRLFGAPCIWAEPLREEKQQNKTKGGKYNDYKYFGTWAVMMTDHEIEAVTRIWFDKHLVYDATGGGPLSPFSIEGGSIVDFMRIYTGATDQEPDPRIQATVDAALGAGMTPAYRGRSYVVFEDLPLEKLGNRLPQVDVEVVAIAGGAFPRQLRDTDIDPSSVIGFSADHSRLINVAPGGAFEIWDVATMTRIISGDLGAPVISSGSSPQQALTSSARTGAFYAVTYDSGVFDYDVMMFNADGSGAQYIAGPYLLPDYVLSFVVGEREFLGVTRRGIDGGGWWIEVTNPNAPAAVFIDPTAYLPGGANARIKHFFQDVDGDVWALCGHIDLADDEIGLIRMTGVPVARIVTMSGGVGATDAPLYGYHYRDPDVDHFVIARAFTTPGWALVDAQTFTETASAVISLGTNVAYPWASIRPGARYYYEAALRVDSRDLSVTAYDLDDWGGGGSISGLEVYDEINHAIIKRYSSTQLGWFFLDRISGEGVTLQSIVEDVAARCGLDVANDIDASALDQTVEGYSWVQGQGKAILEPLLEYHNSEVRPHDFELQFIKRGGTSTDVIQAAEMVPDGGKRYGVTRTLDTDLPRGVAVNFADPAMDQQPNSARTQRYADTTDGRREVSLDVSTMVADIDAARSAADGYLRRAWFSAEGYDLAVTRAQTRLEPGDHRLLVLDDVTRVGKCAELTFGADGVLSARFVRDGTTPHIIDDTPPTPSTQHVPQTQPGAPADGYVPPVIPVPAYSRGLVMDIPLAEDSHDGLILYMAAGPYATDVTWGGALIYESEDAGETYDLAEPVTTDLQAVWGVTGDVLPEALADVWDRASTVNVTLHSGSLTSVTEAQAENGANLALIGDEIVAFTTATLEVDGSYTLSGFLRGRRGTEQHVAGHASGESFVMLSNTVRHTQGVSDLATDFTYRTVSAGSINQTGFTQALEFTGASRKPYSPVHLEVEDDSGDLVLTWVRRTRLGGFNVYSTTPPLAESAEEYEVDILDGSDVVLRTYDSLSSPTATYTAADQASDSGAGVLARVYQMSSTVGRGFPAEIAI